MGTKSSEQSVPDCLDGNVAFDDILGRFRTIYEELYNSAGAEEAMQDIKARLQGMYF